MALKQSNNLLEQKPPTVNVTTPSRTTVTAVKRDRQGEIEETTTRGLE